MSTTLIVCAASTYDWAMGLRVIIVLQSDHEIVRAGCHPFAIAHVRW